LVRRSARAILVLFIVLLAASGAALADDGAHPMPHLWTVTGSWLVPVGLGLLACGAVPPGRTAAVIRVGWLALGVAVIGYWLCGFAFQFGGVGFVPNLHPDLAGLAREWAWQPLVATWGGSWGMLGLEGYMLRGAASTPTALFLFLSQLPWITTAVAIPLWSLQGRTRPLPLFLSGVLIAFVYTLLGNWTWGGGWLANLGLNLKLGHGFVDFYGIGAVHLAGAASALAGMLAFGARRFARPDALPGSASNADRCERATVSDLGSAERDVAQDSAATDHDAYVPMPPLHLPILATLGTWLAVIGWIGWGQSTPLHVTTGLNLLAAETFIGLALATAGGAMVAIAFSWLTTGQANALMTARGALGAAIAAGAGVPFVPFWAALAIGAGAGLLVPLVQYLVEHLLRLDDPTSAIATHGVPALWGLLTVGLFADGHAGQGWNGIGADAYLDVEGQGITGYLAATGYVGDWPGQFQAQATGVVAIFLIAFFLSWLLFAAIQGLAHAWQGEYTIRLPKRPRHKRERPPTPQRRWPRIRIVRTEPEPDRGPAGETPRPAPRRWRASLKDAFRHAVAKIENVASRAKKTPRRDDAKTQK
jgi:Amt family ammonium transporter